MDTEKQLLGVGGSWGIATIDLSEGSLIKTKRAPLAKEPKPTCFIRPVGHSP